jgi:Outer membrane protein and related peptidoglycan-associated (lipo)proteins
MKATQLAKSLLFALAITAAAFGCHKRPSNVTDLPGYKPELVGDPFANTDTNLLAGSGTNMPLPMSNPDLRKDWPRDHKIFAADTVHFDYDSSVVKSGEKSKVIAVAAYLKANTADAVEIEGHCDERGTEEYNRSLGDRRALALREALAAQGVDPMRVDTISYGKDRPVDTGKSETSHRKNRRGEFVLEKHPQ